jgi:hypothetical protein
VPDRPLALSRRDDEAGATASVQVRLAAVESNGYPLRASGRVYELRAASKKVICLTTIIGCLVRQVYGGPWGGNQRRELRGPARGPYRNPFPAVMSNPDRARANVASARAWSPRSAISSAIWCRLVSVSGWSAPSMQSWAARKSLVLRIGPAWPPGADISRAGWAPDALEMRLDLRMHRSSAPTGRTLVCHWRVLRHRRLGGRRRRDCRRHRSLEVRGSARSPGVQHAGSRATGEPVSARVQRTSGDAPRQTGSRSVRGYSPPVQSWTS